MRRRIALAVAFVVALLAAPTALRADTPVVSKKMWFGERKGNLAVTTSYTELLDETAYERLGSGFATNIVARIYVYRKGRDLPVSFVMASARVVYDLWDEVYVVRTHGPGGRRTRRFNSRAEALVALTEFSELPIADLAEIPRGDLHYLAMVVELNPVSEELLAEMRRWLTRPAGSTSVDRGSSFFGSFVSVFVNPKMPEADRVLRFRSQPFFRPKVAGSRE